MNTNGFIQLGREFTEWQWYDDGSAVRLFLHLLLTANYAPVKWHGITVERGQRVVTLSKLSEETGIPRTTLFRTLEKLKKSGDVEQKRNGVFTVLTVKNYNSLISGGTETEQKWNKNETETEQKRNNYYNNKNNKKNNNNNSINAGKTFSNNSIDIDSLEEAAFERYRKTAAQRAESG